MTKRLQHYTEHVKILTDKQFKLREDWTVDVREYQEKLKEATHQLDFYASQREPIEDTPEVSREDLYGAPAQS
jgi:phage gp36-like protein